MCGCSAPSFVLTGRDRHLWDPFSVHFSLCINLEFIITASSRRCELSFILSSLDDSRCQEAESWLHLKSGRLTECDLWVQKADRCTFSDVVEILIISRRISPITLDDTRVFYVTGWVETDMAQTLWLFGLQHYSSSVGRIRVSQLSRWWYRFCWCVWW